MKRGFSKLDNPDHEGNTNTWLTPLNIINALGEFDLDPCGYPGHPTANKLMCLPTNGLINDWKGRVWLNPPYGRDLPLWLNKMEKHRNGIVLLYGRTETIWFQQCTPDAIFFIKGRVAFLRPDGAISSNAGHGSVFLIYGEDNILSVINSGLAGKIMK